MSSSTFLKLKAGPEHRYVNPDKIRTFHSYSEDSTLITFEENDYFVADISVEDFEKMLQESNWFIKKYE